MPATRTWVSGVGDDVNPGSRTAPCKTFAGAISKTNDGGEISVLDPGGFGAVTITKSITIDGTGTFASILAFGTNGVVINGANINVILRGLSIQGAGAGLTGVRIVNAANVHIEDCVISGFKSGAGRGVDDLRTAGGRLFITRTTIRENSQQGVNIKPQSGASAILGFLDRVELKGNATSGLLAGAGSRVSISNSLIVGNPGNGLFANATAALGGPEINAENCVIMSNGTGLNCDSGSFLNISNVFVMTNSTGLTGAGTFGTFGNNRIIENGSGNTVPGNPPPIPPR
jgi:hypothetical protein